MFAFGILKWHQLYWYRCLHEQSRPVVPHSRRFPHVSAACEVATCFHTYLYICVRRCSLWFYVSMLLCLRQTCAQLGTWSGDGRIGATQGSLSNTDSSAVASRWCTCPLALDDASCRSVLRVTVLVGGCLWHAVYQRSKILGGTPPNNCG